jgi:hypothetical protein
MTSGQVIVISWTSNCLVESLPDILLTHLMKYEFPHCIAQKKHKVRRIEKRASLARVGRDTATLREAIHHSVCSYRHMYANLE